MKEASLLRVQNIKILPRISKKVATALTRILLLDDLQVKQQNKFIEMIEDFLSTLENSNIIISGFSFDDAYSSIYLKNDNYTRIKFEMTRTKSQMGSLEIALEGSESVISEQYEIINNQINYYQNLGYLITAGFITI